MDRIVFLDIDGVVNSPKNYHEWNAAHTEGSTDGYDESPAEDRHVLKLFDQDNISVLNRITTEGDARIVISSSWRMFFSGRRFDDLQTILESAGVTGEVVCPTPTIQPQRGMAIEQFLYLHRRDKKTNIVILDDEGPSSFGKSLSRWLVQTDPSTGLKSDDVDRALKVLNGRKYVS